MNGRRLVTRPVETDVVSAGLAVLIAWALRTAVHRTTPFGWQVWR
jgi:hypothetical protein